MTQDIYFISSDAETTEIAKNWALKLNLEVYRFFTLSYETDHLPSELLPRLENAKHIIFLNTEKHIRLPHEIYNFPNFQVWDLMTIDYLSTDTSNIISQKLSDIIALKISYFAESLELITY